MRARGGDPQTAADIQGFAEHSQEGVIVLRVGGGRPDNHVDAGQDRAVQEDLEVAEVVGLFVEAPLISKLVCRI